VEEAGWKIFSDGPNGGPVNGLGEGDEEESVGISVFLTLNCIGSVFWRHTFSLSNSELQ